LEWPATKNKWEGVSALSWSRDGRWIAGCLCGSRQAVVWDVATRRIAKSARLPQEPHAVALSADSRRLAIGGKQLLQVRDVGDFKVQFDKKDMDAKVCSVALSPDDTPTAKRLSPRESHWGFAWAARFSADGTTIVSGGSDGVRFWDRRTGRLLRRLPGDEHHVGRCAFSHDEKRVALARTDKTGVNGRMPG